MELQGLTPILNVSDVPASRAWFARLGWQRGFSWNRGGLIEGGADGNAHGPADFGSVCSGRFELFLCLDGQGPRRDPDHPAADDERAGVWMSWWLASPAAVDALHERARAEGLEIARPPTDEPWGVREFHLRHPDGHTFRVSAGLPS